MTIYSYFILACWLVLFGYWLLSAFGAKRTVGGGGWWLGMSVRIGAIVIIVLILRLPGGRTFLRDFRYGLVFSSPILRSVGVVLCAGGVALAIWARLCLGRSWGMPMSRKEDPDLVVQGPYAAIRHPIYAGFLAALLGSSLAASAIWLVPFVLFGAYFIYSAIKEEHIMTRQFPGAYPAYRKRTRMLIPFVL